MYLRPDFKAIKATCSIEDFLAASGWNPTRSRSPSLLSGPCPVHRGDNPRAFVVWRRHKRWYCFTGCQHGGDIIDLAAALWHCSLHQAAVRLAGTMPQELIPRPPPRPWPPVEQRLFRPFSWTLPLNPTVPFLRRKGIHPQTARTFEAGAYSGSGWLRGCLGVRLFDPQGTPIGYAGRRLAPQPTLSKWRFPPGLPAGSLLYNYHRVVAEGARHCVLVECPWSVMRLHQVGLPALALMGVGLSQQQERLLERFDRILLLLDGDPAGQAAAQRLYQRLSPSRELAVHRLPTGLDPDDLPPETLSKLQVYLEGSPVQGSTPSKASRTGVNRPQACPTSPPFQVQKTSIPPSTAKSAT